ncbi:MAG: hypothetical protein ABR579_06520 [Actinomycetota bacterium]
MTDSPGSTRAHNEPGKVERALAHPLAFLTTAAILLVTFGWTFLANAGRVAPTKDPAYYTWRTDGLLALKPSVLLGITGPFNVFSSGYRVSSIVLMGLIRRIAGVGSLQAPSILVVGIPIVTALLLAGFAYRRFRDPLVFHAVALGSASLLLTPPFVGYLDNILCLFFLAAALCFIEGTRDSWPARIGFGALLLAASFTHPTTLVIFVAILGAMAVAKFVYRRFDLRAAWAEDGWMLIVALVAVVLMYGFWKVGVWGPKESLGEAALAPPYGSSFFLDRMRLWVDAMHPAINGPLFAIGAIGLLAAGRRAIDNEVARISILWLLPLAGLFGFLAGLTYPYYRFFNTTLAWVLLPALGIYFAARFFIDRARSGGLGVIAAVGLVALAAAIGSNFAEGFHVSGWANASGGWLSSAERADLDSSRAYLQGNQRPIVFVADEEASPEFQIYGFTKLTGNTSRYGVSPDQLDKTFLYLGSLQNYLQDQPTTTGGATYDKLSKAYLTDIQNGTKSLDLIPGPVGPTVVLADVFNQSGANTGYFDGTKEVPAGVVTVKDGKVIPPLSADSTESSVLGEPKAPGVMHVVRVIIGILFLLLPGLIAFRWLFPNGSLAEALGMVPALAVAALCLAGIFVLAIARSPLSTSLAFASWAVAAIGTAVMLRFVRIPPRGKPEAPATE